MNNSTIFYAWQSDTDAKTNHYFIRDSLKTAITQLARQEEVVDCPRLDHDTANVPGTPPIAETIFAKIDSSVIFVADVTFISNSNTKKLPNPNVMIELGYALKSVSDSRIILVMNTAYGNPDQLPFDLRNRRYPISYYLESNNSDQKKDAKNKLIAQLQTAIGSILKIPVKTTTHKLSIKASPVRHGQQQCAHLKLFNSGPGAIMIDSWWVEWQAESKGGRRSWETINGRLPQRIQEQDFHEILIDIGRDIEEIRKIGVFDGDSKLWPLSDDQLVVFKHHALSHRLPGEKARPIDPPPTKCPVTLRPEACPRINMPDRLRMVFQNDEPVKVNVTNVYIRWEYSVPRAVPNNSKGMSVAEAGGSVSLTRRTQIGPVDPAESIIYELDDDMSSLIVEMLRGDVNDENILIEFIISDYQWSANMDDIPSTVKQVANSVLTHLLRTSHA